MTAPVSPEVSALIHAWNDGDRSALDRLTPLIYSELRRMAKRFMRRQPPGHTLQTTALLHDAYLHLVGAKGVRCQDRTQFLAFSAQIMRRILIDAARARASHKRGGMAKRTDHSTPVNLDEIPAVNTHRGPELLALEDALVSLQQIDDRKAKIVELRFYGGLSVEETAEVLNVSPQTVTRDWRLTRLWLAKELGAAGSDQGRGNEP